MSDGLREAALGALRLALRPLFRILLRSGVTWQQASEVCKATLVEVASADFGLHGRPTNMSRVAILTGLSRREVRRLRDVLAASPALDAGRLHGATGVLTGWHLDPAFLDPAGRPRDLAFVAAPDAAPGFSELCRRYGGDLAPITLRRELARVGAIAELPGDTLRVLKRYYMPLLMDPEAVIRGGSMLEDLGTTVAFDLARPADEPSRFLGRATNVRMRPADARAFHAFLEAEGEAFLERVDAWLSAREAGPGRGTAAGATARRVRLGAGVYAILDDRKP